MTGRISQQPAYMIHKTPYRESGFWIDFFTLNHGMVRLLAKGARKSKTMPSSLLQPFQPLLIDWLDKGDIKFLNSLEQSQRLPLLKDETLFCGFYLNELLQKLMTSQEPALPLFMAYAQALMLLTQEAELDILIDTNGLMADKPDSVGNVPSLQIKTEIALRHVEFALVDYLGCLPDLVLDAPEASQIQADMIYQWVQEMGFVPLNKLKQVVIEISGVLVEPFPAHQFEGEDILGLSQRNFLNESVRKAAKRLMRILINQLLQGSPLKSREMIKQSRKRHG